MTIEVWKSVVGLEGYYQVSNLGQVRSVDRTVNHKGAIRQKVRSYKGQLLTPRQLRGYVRVCVTKEGRSWNKQVHRLVAIAFIPNPENKPQVNHIDGVKSNNNVENLEWATSQENCVHAHEAGLRTGRKGVENSQARLTPEIVRKIRELRKSGHSYGSIGRAIGICTMQAHRIVNGKQWGHVDN
jgi:hypothetical protein